MLRSKKRTGGKAVAQTAIVVVSKDWIDTAVRHLINHGQQSRSTGETHVIFADLEDTSDHRGLWLKNVRTTRLTTDGSNITMRFMIPWSFIVALGVVDHGAPVEPGFAGCVVFEPADVTNQSTRRAAEAN